MNVFIGFQFQMSKKRNMRILNGFEEFFCLPSNLSSDDIISAFSEIGYGFWRSGLKTSVENGIFGLK